MVYEFSSTRSEISENIESNENDEEKKDSSKDVCIISNRVSEYCHDRVSPQNCDKWARDAGSGFVSKFVVGGRCHKEYPQKNIPDETDKGTCILTGAKTGKEFCKSNYSYKGCKNWGARSRGWTQRFTLLEKCKSEYPAENK